jgi:hypothetical protein
MNPKEEKEERAAPAGVDKYDRTLDWSCVAVECIIVLVICVMEELNSVVFPRIVEEKDDCKNAFPVLYKDDTRLDV